MSAETERLTLKALRLAVLAGWLMLGALVVQVAISATRACPPCATCLPAEKPDR
jgi:hypothetical protein